MTAFILSLDQLDEKHRPLVGGKAFSLAAMHRNGFIVPPAICITVDAYLYYVASTGLADQIVLELYRKRFEEMRWEEIWDTSLRIRNAFLKTPLPVDLQAAILKESESQFSATPVSIRSSAPGEDSSKASFAGLHESFINIRGPESILEHVRLVWASLWSDRALLYRREIGLDVKKSAMAVLVQEMILGERSGIIFGKSPTDAGLSVIEAVHGLNQGLVDGTIAPDRWHLDRKTGKALTHVPAVREKAMQPGEHGSRIESLPPALRDQPPLVETELSEVYDLCMRSESIFHSPQDMEWTYRGMDLHALQSRPITTDLQTKADDQRPWYLSLHRSFENLKALRTKIEDELIPAMENEAHELARMDLGSLSNTKLADEIDRRRQIHQQWLDVYKRDCIPFAHGMRLFGQVYNDVVQPKDPYEFMELLSGEKTLGLQRNSMLEEMADMVRSGPELARVLREKEDIEDYPGFAALLDTFVRKYGSISRATAGEPPPREARDKVMGLVLEMAAQGRKTPGARTRNRTSLEDGFLSKSGESRLEFARELLDLARASYRWRDDDNIYLARIEAETARAVQLGRQRIAVRLGLDPGVLTTGDVSLALTNHDYRPQVEGREVERTTEVPDLSLRPRQLTGLPAGPGIGTGTARIISDSDDLYAFKSGEVLVCDAIEPEMTLVVPLAAGIVERRGGMLIHGAIVAREYGIPCVTGVPNAASLIKSGNTVTVDGYLGIVIIEGGRGVEVVKPV